MAKEKFWFVFEDEPQKKYFIDEPINYGNVDFTLNQKENGFGRDVSLSGDKVQLRFTIERNHYLDKLLYLNHYSGFESKVKLFIETEIKTIFSGELDFYTSTTNDYDFFECSVILESALQVFKRRMKIKVDLFSAIGINLESIDPLLPENMLLQSKPSSQTSRWENVSKAKVIGGALITGIAVNLCQFLIDSDVEDSYSFFVDRTFYNSTNLDNRDTFLMVEAKTNLKNVTVLVSGIEISTNDIAELHLYLDDNKTILLTVPPNTGITKTNITYTIGNVERGQKISVFFRLRGSNIFLQQDFIQITAQSVAYNTITPVFRLIDVMKQVAKSIAGLEVYAPRYDLGGEFYDTVLTNGNLLRGAKDKPFYISWEDLERSMNNEALADNEIQLDGKVFQGIYEDFHTNEECGSYEDVQFSDFGAKYNPMYCLNGVTYKYDNYQSQKETTQPNSESTIHGEKTFTPSNENVENEKEFTIKWIRDAIMLDAQQRLSTTVTKDTATQDDDKIFAIDTIFTENDQKFTERTVLQHSYESDHLFLRSNGEVNFLVLGIVPGTTFGILYPDSNAGNYTVISVINTQLELSKISGGTSSIANNGIRLTAYTYEIRKDLVPLTNRTNEGFSVVLNLISPEKYSNLRYSVERNIRNYFNKFLATINIYRKKNPLSKTFYKNNEKCETEYLGLRVIEGEDFTPSDPIVTPRMYENVIIANMSFDDFITLQEKIRTLRGFIKTVDNNLIVKRIYPTKMSYENKSRQLTMSGQEKFEKSWLTIVKEGDLITINDETRLRKIFYDPLVLDQTKKLVLFSVEKQRLYNGIYWDKVSINGETYDTIEILKSKLDLL